MMKSKPQKPDSFNRDATSWATRFMSSFWMTRTIIAAPVGPSVATTATDAKDSNSPRQHTSMELAGRPGMNSWIVTPRADWRPCNHNASGSRSIARRFQAVALPPGARSARQATSDSSSDRVIVTPLPPEPPSTLSTDIDSRSRCHVVRSSGLSIFRNSRQLVSPIRRPRLEIDGGPRQRDSSPEAPGNAR